MVRVLYCSYLEIAYSGEQAKFNLKSLWGGRKSPRGTNTPHSSVYHTKPLEYHNIINCYTMCMSHKNVNTNQTLTSHKNTIQCSILLYMGHVVFNTCTFMTVCMYMYYLLRIMCLCTCISTLLYV